MAEAGFRAYAVDPLIKVLPKSAPSAVTPDGVKIDAVRNEYESGQIVITAGDKRIERLTAEPAELSGPAGVKPHVEVEFVGCVPVKYGTTDTPEDHLVSKTPVDIPDPLLDASSVSVEAGASQALWITVYVPKGAEPGTYSGTVQVSADGTTASVPVSIRVHPFTLPDERTLFLTNWFDPGHIASGHGLDLWSEPFWKVLGAYAQCMADHRQNVVITPIMQLVKGRDDGKGNLSFDFSAFDRWVELFRSKGVIGTIEGGHLGGRNEWEAKDFNASWPTITNPDGSAKTNPSVTVTSEEERRFLSQFLPALQKHLQEKGWLAHYVQHLCDEPIPANAESYKKLASYVKEYAPEIRIIDACMCSELTGAIDIWVPQPPHFENELKFFRERQKAGDEVWYYTCLSPKGKYLNRFIDFPLLDVRLLHWANFKFDLPGYLHWGLTYWGAEPFKDLEPDWGGGSHLPPGDSHIVYPGKRGPLSSIRFEALRDGCEDFEMLKIFAAKDPKAAQKVCDSVIRSFTEYTTDPAAFRRARIQLIESLGK